MTRKAALWSAAAVAALAAWSTAQAEERRNLGAGLSLRADRVETDERGMRLYLPSLPSEPIVISPQLAQILGAQSARANAGSALQAAIHGSNTIGSELMVNLIKAYANAKEAEAVTSATGEDEMTIEIKQRGSDAPSATI